MTLNDRGPVAYQSLRQPTTAIWVTWVVDSGSSHAVWRNAKRRRVSLRRLAAGRSPELCGADSRACGTPLQCSPLIFAETAPDTMILTSFQRPLQTCVPDLTSPADLLGLFYLEKGRAGIPNWEEQLRVLVQASGPVAPIHWRNTPNWLLWALGVGPRRMGKRVVLYTEV